MQGDSGPVTVRWGAVTSLEGAFANVVEGFLLSQCWRPDHRCHSVVRARDARYPVMHETLLK